MPGLGSYNDTIQGLILRNEEHSNKLSYIRLTTEKKAWLSTKEPEDKNAGRTFLGNLGMKNIALTEV